MNLEGLVLA